MDTTQTDPDTSLARGADLLSELQTADPAAAPEPAEALAELLTDRLDATSAGHSAVATQPQQLQVRLDDDQELSA